MPRKALLGTCDRLGALFENPFVVLRGAKSIKSIVSCASSKGFSNVLIVNGERAQKLAVLKAKALGNGYVWGNEYALKTTKTRLYVERGGKDAKKTLVREASD